jgi:hypothetical protein
VSGVPISPLANKYALGDFALLFAYRPYANPPGRSLSATVRQAVPSVEGFTQASSVMPVLKSKLAESFTVTQLLVPLNDNALPNLPAALHEAPVIAPVFAQPETSLTVSPAPSSKP